MGKDTNKNYFTLTDERMTRFIMSLKDSCNLIEYAILYGNNGETIIPTIKSMYIKDIFEIFSELYKKPIKIVGLRAGEKLYESLINGTQHLLTYKKNGYYHIAPSYKKELLNTDQIDINSNFNLLTKQDLKELLINLQLIDVPTDNDRTNNKIPTADDQWFNNESHPIESVKSKNNEIGFAYELGC